MYFSRYPAESGTQVTTVGPQTYIVAQNPEVLAHLMRENENRVVNPSAYTTPASVFNTIAVDFDDAEKTEAPALKTIPIPIQSLQQLDPDQENPTPEPAVEPDVIETPPPPPSSSSLTSVDVIGCSVSPPVVPDLVCSQSIQSVCSQPIQPICSQPIQPVCSQPIYSKSVCSQPISFQPVAQQAALVEGIYDFGGADVKSCAFKGTTSALNQTLVQAATTASQRVDTPVQQQIQVWNCCYRGCCLQEKNIKPASMFLHEYQAFKITSLAVRSTVVSLFRLVELGKIFYNSNCIMILIFYLEIIN